MKMRAAAFDDDQEPERFTVEVSLDELALLYRFVGHISPARITELAGDVRWGNALYDVADGISTIFNTFFDDGVNDVIPRFGVYQAQED